MQVEVSQMVDIPDTDAAALVLYARHAGYDYQVAGVEPSTEELVRRVTEREGYEGLATGIRAGRFIMRRGKFPEDDQLYRRPFGSRIETRDQLGNARRG